jgi:hypothetical protein
MRLIWVQEPLPFPGDGVYNQGVPAPAESCESEIHHAVLELLVSLVEWLAVVHPGVIDEFDAAVLAARREESGD